MKPEPHHRFQVLRSPWPGVHGTVMDSARHFVKHSHATYGLGWLEQGGQTSASGRGVVEARAGDLIATNPGEVHDGRPLGLPSRRWKMVYLEPHVVVDACGQRAGALADIEIKRPVIQDPPLALALAHLLGCLEAWTTAEAANSVSALACEEALVQVSALLVRGHTDVAQPTTLCGADGVAMQRVRERLAAASTDGDNAAASLSELASLCGLSKYQVLRRFQKTYGVPPHVWLVSLRCERARAAIQRGASLSDAAASAGFADQSHLSRQFLRQFGYTPGAWRMAATPPSLVSTSLQFRSRHGASR
jgi:AraC-like DNA-binding protein